MTTETLILYQQFKNIVLNFGESDPTWGIKKGELIAQRFSDGNVERTQSRYWVPLIWNALKIKGYDVPDHLIANDFGEELRQRLIINSTELSQIQNWDKYAIEVLSNAYTESFSEGDNRFDSQKVRVLSERYKTSSVNKNFDYLKNYRKKF